MIHYASFRYGGEDYLAFGVVENYLDVLVERSHERYVRHGQTRWPSWAKFMHGEMVDYEGNSAVSVDPPRTLHRLNAHAAAGCLTLLPLGLGSSYVLYVPGGGAGSASRPCAAHLGVVMSRRNVSHVGDDAEADSEDQDGDVCEQTQCDLH